MRLLDELNQRLQGKCDKPDYTADDLPETRIRLFGMVLKARWNGLMGVNLLYGAAWLPAIVWTIVNVVMFTAQETRQTAAETVEYLTMYFLVLVPCVSLTGPFTAGVSYVMRNWARDEHSFVWSDYWDAVRANWKQALLVSIISGFGPLVVYVCWMYYGAMEDVYSAFAWIAMGLALLAFILWKLIEMLIYTIMVTYDLKFKELIYNSMLLSIAKLPLAVGIKLLTLVLPILGILIVFIVPHSETYVFLIVGFLYMVFVPAVNRLILASYANAMCENYMNDKIENARIGIGLKPKDP